MALHTKPQLSTCSCGKYILALISVELHENKVQTWFIKPSKFCIYWYETKIMIPPSVQEKTLPLCNPVEHMSTKEKEKETLASLVTKLMHLSMLSPRVGGGWQAHPGEFDIFTRARVKFPTPGHLQNVKFPSQGTAFCPKQVVAMSNSRPQGITRMSKSPPWEKLAESTSCG